MGKVVPYGIYDIGANLGYVSLGIDHDTGQFAVNSVRCWFDRMGRDRYPKMTRLMIAADGGGSNGSRLRLWKLALQQLADDTGHGFGGNREAQSDRAAAWREDRRGDSYHGAVERQQRTAGIAAVDGRVGLQEVDIRVVFERTSPRRHDAGAH